MGGIRRAGRGRWIDSYEWNEMKLEGKKMMKGTREPNWMASLRWNWCHWPRWSVIVQGRCVQLPGGHTVHHMPRPYTKSQIIDNFQCLLDAFVRVASSEFFTKEWVANVPAGNQVRTIHSWRLRPSPNISCLPIIGKVNSFTLFPLPSPRCPTFQTK